MFFKKVPLKERKHMLQIRRKNFAGLVRWITALATKAKDLSSSPRIHMMEGENPFLQIVL